MPATYKADRDIHRRLRHACWKGDLSAAKRMLGRGADVEAKDGDRFTPLLIASRWGRRQMCEFLIDECNVNLAAKNQEGNSAYNLAKLYHFDELAEYLVSKGVSDAENQLTVTRQASADQWLASAIAGQGPPTTSMIEAIRDNVHERYSALEKEASDADLAEAIEAATGLDSEAAQRNREADVVGQVTFPVRQTAVRSAPKTGCRLGVGSMGLALFDGVKPVATWPYSLVASTAVKSVKGSGELVVMVRTTGTKEKRVVFRTMHAADLNKLIVEKIEELTAAPKPAAPAPAPAHAAAGGETACAGTAPAGGGTESKVESSGVDDQPESVSALDLEHEGDGGGAADSSISKTIWVGNIPAALCGGGDDVNGPLAALFAPFGSVISITIRRKLDTPKAAADDSGGDGAAGVAVNKSWAFVSFSSAQAADLALAASVCTTNGDEEVVLTTRAANVEEKLRSPTTGALAEIWQQQQEKERQWVQSLLVGLNEDSKYQAAKADVARKMGLRAEELEDELEEQEFQAIQEFAAMCAVEDDAGDLLDDDMAVDEGEQGAAVASPGGARLGMPPSSAAPLPTGGVVEGAAVLDEASESVGESNDVSADCV